MLMRTEGEPSIPAGLVEVSEEEFFKLLFADKRDIMPSHMNPLFTDWEIAHGRMRWGWSFPGWRNTGQPKRYAVIATAKP